MLVSIAAVLYQIVYITGTYGPSPAPATFPVDPSSLILYWAVGAIDQGISPAVCSIDLEFVPKSGGSWLSIHSQLIHAGGLSVRYRYDSFNHSVNDYRISLKNINSNFTSTVWGSYMTSRVAEPFRVTLHGQKNVTSGRRLTIPLYPRTQYISGILANSDTCRLGVSNGIHNAEVWDPASPNLDFNYAQSYQDFEAASLGVYSYNYLHNFTIEVDMTVTIVVGAWDVLDEVQHGMYVPTLYLPPSSSFGHVDLKLPRPIEAIYWSFDLHPKIQILSLTKTVIHSAEPEMTEKTQRGMYRFDVPDARYFLRIASFEDAVSSTLGAAIAAKTVDVDKFDTTLSIRRNTVLGKDERSLFKLFSQTLSLKWDLDASLAGLDAQVWSPDDVLYKVITTELVQSEPIDLTTPEMEHFVEFDVVNPLAPDVVLHSLNLTYTLHGEKPAPPPHGLSGGAIAGIVIGTIVLLAIFAVVVIVVILLLRRFVFQGKRGYQEVGVEVPDIG